MVYSTFYTLTVTGQSVAKDFGSIEHWLDKCDVFSHALDHGVVNGPDTIYFANHDYVSWDDASDQIAGLSRVFPNYLFCLSGGGEFIDDFWREYFKNGMEQLCYGEIVYPPFDELKLVPWEVDKDV